MRKASKLLVINRAARAVNDEVESRLRQEFSDHLVVDLNDRRHFASLITQRAQVVVAGGDGAVEHVMRKLSDSKRTLGIVPLGSFNNLALALGLPVELEPAIKVVKDGKPRAITLGRVNRKLFLEACAVGLFGEAIVLGDAAKDLHFGDVMTRLRQLIESRRFAYQLSGDLRGSGTAMSLVFANTPSIGTQLPVSSAKPTSPYLELSVDAGHSAADIVGRVLASALLAKHDEDSARTFRFKKVRVTTRPRVRVYADNQHAGRTPATISAEVSKFKVILPG